MIGIILCPWREGVIQYFVWIIASLEGYSVFLDNNGSLEGYIN